MSMIFCPDIILALLTLAALAMVDGGNRHDLHCPIPLIRLVISWMIIYRSDSASIQRKRDWYICTYNTPEIIKADGYMSDQWSLGAPALPGWLPLRVSNPMVHLNQLRFTQSVSNPVVPPPAPKPIQNQSASPPTQSSRGEQNQLQSSRD